MIIIRAIHRSCLEEAQCIIHKSHIPFVIKSQAIIFCRCRYFREICGVLCHQNSRRMQLMEACIHISQKFHCTLIDTSCRITIPVNGTADGIHTDSVKMKFCQPVISGALQETSDFSTAVHKIHRSPLTVGGIRMWELI